MVELVDPILVITSHVYPIFMPLISRSLTRPYIVPHLNIVRSTYFNPMWLNILIDIDFGGLFYPVFPLTVL